MPTHKSSRPARDLPRLLQFADDLVSLTEGLLAGTIHYSEEDHLAFMGLLFVSQQLQLLKSIRVLVAHDLGASAGLIARAMLEGMCLLLWCGRHPESRPLEWRANAYIKDFRLMRQQEARGETVPETRKAEIRQGLEQYGCTLWSNKARKAEEQGQNLPSDPYVKHWPGIAKEQMFDEVQGTQLYQHIYRNLSGLTHWDVASLAGGIRRDSTGVCYSGSSPDSSAAALTVGFQSLVQSLELLDGHLQLGKGQEISDLKQQYIRALTN